MARRKLHVESPRRSPRFPNVSSDGWVEVRRDPAKAHRVFRFFSDVLTPAGAFDKLHTTQRVELVAMVARLQARNRDWRGDRYVQQQFKNLDREARGQANKLKSKLRHVGRALDDLTDYAERLREHLRGETILGWGVGLSSEQRIPDVKSLRAEAERFRKMRPATMEEITADAQNILGGTKPVLIVLDTLARMFAGKDENAARDAGEWIAASARLQGEFNATVFTVHHTGKDGKSERGSGAFRGALDTAILVKKSGTTITVSCEKQKDEEEFDSLAFALATVELPSGDSSCVLVDGAAPGLSNAGLTPTNMRMLRGLTNCSSVPAAVSEWKDVVNKDGQGDVAPRTFDRWRKGLVSEYVVSPHNGHYELTTAGKSAIAKHPPTSATA